MRATLFGLLLVVWPLAAMAGPAADSSAIRALLQEDGAKGFTGVVTLTRLDGQMITTQTAGAPPLHTESRFWIASSGKQFVAAAIFRCVEHGLLSLNDPLSKFFPEAPPDKRGITVRQLLAHLSGLGQTYASEGATTRDAAVRAMLGKPLIDKPGAKFHYSNDNYQLAAAIVEVVSKTDYRSFVTHAFFEPQKLTNTGFNFTPGAALVAPTHEALPPRLLKPTWGEAGVYSSGYNLARWYCDLRGGKVLTPKSVATMFAPAAPIGEGHTALGWYLGKTARGTPTVFVRGNEDFGANSLLYAYPTKDRVLVILTHAGDADDDHSWSRLLLGQIEEKLGL